ncbi:hypothetical protein [Granulicella cerasi]|uniref:hypothetical protein n=1 Tax=Granulicella cerasi TaxID=741063 RepID=UPI0021E09DF5|nr:hypothetical protein [Granulicella cerasi]
MLRKLIAITLLAIFGLPFASSLFALTPKSEANLPACCRRGGKHHCSMNMAGGSDSSSSQPHFSAPVEKCPYAPMMHVADHQPMMLPMTYVAFRAPSLERQPDIVRQAESAMRISRERSRHKRGPPVVSSLSN